MDKIIEFISKQYREFEVCRKRKDAYSMEKSGDGVRTENIIKTEWAIRVFKDGRAGFAYVSGENPDTGSVSLNLEQSLANAFEDKDNRLPSAGRAETLLCSGRMPVERSRINDIVKEMEEEAKSKRLIKKIERVSGGSEYAAVDFYNSATGLQRQETVKYSAGIVLIAEKDSDEKLEWDYAVHDDINYISGRNIVARACGRAERLLNPADIRTGKYPVLLEGRAACDFLEVLAQGFIGENVYKKRSMIADSTEFSERISMYDHPLEPAAGAAYFFDGDGVKSAKTCIMEKGRVKNFLCDSYYGRKLGRASTGNAIRGSMAVPPRNGFSNVWIEPADGLLLSSSLNDLPQTVGVVSVIGMHLVNPVSGDVSVGLEGYLFEKGQYQRSILRAGLSGNLKEIFSNVIAVGNDFSFYGQAGSPSILIEGMTVTGS